MASFHELSPDDWRQVVAANLDSAAFVCREAIRRMLDAGGGAIVNIVADMWGGMPGMGHSGAARAGMVNFTQTAAYEWGSCGVRVNAVCPSFTETDMASGIKESPETYAAFMDRIPMRRPAKPEDIAPVIAFLASDDAGFVTGVNLPVDGGLSASNGQPHM